MRLFMLRFSLIASLFLMCMVGRLSAQGLNIDNLSDQQLLQYMNMTSASDLSSDQLVLKAKEKGLSDDQITKLESRIAKIQSDGVSVSSNNTSLTTSGVDTPRGKVSSSASQSEPLKIGNLSIFGSELFSNKNLTFEPNLRIATPHNYVLGVGDQLIVDVSGINDVTRTFRIEPDGYIRYPYLGRIHVAGLSIEQAALNIKRALVKIYPGLRTNATSVHISLGQIRTIRVSLIGEVRNPGTYSLPSLATIANALYVSGGPNLNGSFRNIQLIREGRTIAVFDLYDFLLNGDLSGNRILQDDDIIKVNTYRLRVKLTGEVKRPAVYEAKNGETLEDLIGYAGNYSDMAYKNVLRLFRIGDVEKEVISIPKTDVTNFTLNSGDSVHVDRILDRYKNKITIVGAVFHPGGYSVDEIPTLNALLKTAGLSEDAYMKRGLIKRYGKDLSTEMLDFNPQEVMEGRSDFKLQRDDSVIVYSKFSLREKYYVTINGAVSHPGIFDYSKGMKVQDLILLAGGCIEGASEKKIEISRRLPSDPLNEKDTSRYVIVHELTMDHGLVSDAFNDTSFILTPFDIVSVRLNPAYRKQVVVHIEGMVLYPGSYSVINRKEKLTDLLTRAGGLRSDAFPEGAVLIRKSNNAGSLNGLLQVESNNSQHADTVVKRSRLDALNNAYSSAVSSSGDSSRLNKAESSLKDEDGTVGIQLVKAIKDPNSVFNLELEEGDILKIPKKIETIQSFGSVYLPQKIVYYKGMSFRDAIDASGGFTADAASRKAYVIYANGQVKSAHSFLFFKHYPKIKPGAELYVPMKKKSDMGAVATMVSMFTSLTAVLISLVYLIKK